MADGRVLIRLSDEVKRSPKVASRREIRASEVADQWSEETGRGAIRYEWQSRLRLAKLDAGPGEEMK